MFKIEIKVITEVLLKFGPVGNNKCSPLFSPFYDHSPFSKNREQRLTNYITVKKMRSVTKKIISGAVVLKRAVQQSRLIGIIHELARAGMLNIITHAYVTENNTHTLDSLLSSSNMAVASIGCCRVSVIRQMRPRSEERT